MFSDKFLSFRLELVDEFHKIVLSPFGHYIILGNSSTNFNLKTKTLIRKLESILNKLYRRILSVLFNESSSSSSSCRAASTDIPDPLSPLLPIFIAYGRSSGLHLVSSHSCCIYVRAGRPAFARPYVGVHRSTSLISSSLILQQRPACLKHIYIHIYIYIERDYNIVITSWE